ncbi:retrovirus-related Pol polyprotein from transposon 17.6 [Trichonephila clavipes]|nr:retrovirus-related Pol polyprotein from transposon 17.6 [Trichonephila clavipes]
MAYLAKGRRQDLLELAETLDISIPDNFKFLDIKDAILKSEGYDVDFTKECLNRIICDRKELELRAEREKENQRIFELQKLQLITNTSKTADSNMPKLELHKLLPIFDPKTTDVTIFLDLFERQLTFLKVPVPQWVVYLVGLLPTEVSNLITKESFADAQDYYKVKQILLKCFKLSAEKFRQMFSRHTKDPVKTWRDFYFDLQTYFDGWLKESKVMTLEELKDLIVADQIKKKAPQDYKDHFLDQWCNWNNPLQLVDKLDSYEEVKNMRNKNKNFSRKQKEMNSNPWRSNYTQNPKLSYEHSLSGFPSQSRRETGIPSNSRRNPISKDRIPEKKIVDTKEDRTPVSCYGCGAPGIIRSRCHTCNPVRQKDNALSSSLNQSNFYSFSSESNPISIIQISICNTEAAVCADTGATHSVAGEKLYHLLKQKGLNFEEKTMQMTLADGRTQTTEILTTSVDISIQEKIIPTDLLILKNARGNRTLLGIDFLTAAGIVLDLQRKQWYFTETSHRKYNFVKAPPNINALLTVDPKPHLCQLRKNEGTHLSLPQREEINSLLEKYEECFQPGGEPTPFIEHCINTRNHLPVAVPPYRMNPSKKEILKQEIDRLLSEGIIEECESPYASPVVLIPKPNGTFCLCIDYRKLNEITVADTYPLPRMDDLLHQAKLTPFMSTLDLRAGYHQVKVHVEDQDKTAFVCPFGTYRFLRMPYGLRNAPATFQRLMNRFCNGLEDILALPYLDDIIVLSETFEKHMFDLKTIFERLLHFKLKANREKCHFASSRVKYLGFWITQKGIEVDPEKVASILDIPPPKNVKELQYFLQTCSWFRRYIQDFAKISRPLSYLTKKKVKWQWGFDQQNAFQTLKNNLTTPPVLKQADGTKPYIIRTDASNYALGAVLLQGEGSDEHPIEYASRLLTPAERNYSTTEREALAVVWALKKFRGYIEGTEITVASDHQPLKWLLNLKSPTGRLARWALEIQSFNLKVQYIPGKANVVADMLSRPVTLHPISSAKNKKTFKFMPKRDGPYLILTQKSPTSYVIASLANPSEPIATYHTSALTPVKDINTSPVAPLRKRGRPRKGTSTSQNKHVPSPSTATTAVSNRTIHPSTRATTAKANYVSSPRRRRLRVEPLRIILKSDLPVHLRPYRTSPIQEIEIKSQVEKLLQAGLIKESNSPYSAPVTLAFKHDEGKMIRLCTDFRKLNALSKADSEPLPIRDSLLDKLVRAKFFSTLDLASTYWHIPIPPKDTEKLAFCIELACMNGADYHLELR